MTLAKELAQEARSNIVALSIGAIPTAIAGLLAWGWPGALEQISDATLSIATPKQILAALCLSLLANAVLAALLISSRSNEPKLKARYGVYWDEDGNAYCPNCNKLTSQIGWVTYKNGQWHGLRCTCTERPFLLMENGEAINAQEAMQKMQGA